MTEPSVILSKQFGLNPSLTFCPRCGEDAQEIILLGDVYDYKCSGCHKHVIGKRPKKCPFCGSSLIVNMGPYDASRKRIPASALCAKCTKLMKEVKEELAKGGVAWKCRDCKSEGVIKHNIEVAIKFRKQYPDNGGLMLTKENCPVCRGVTVGSANA